MCGNLNDSLICFKSLFLIRHFLGNSNKIKRVYELEGLVCDLFAESRDAESKMVPSKHQATELLSTTVFDYESGIRSGSRQLLLLIVAHAKQSSNN